MKNIELPERRKNCFVFSVISLFDSLIGILTFGFIYTSFNMAYVESRMKKARQSAPQGFTCTCDGVTEPDIDYCYRCNLEKALAED